jgi:cytochrome P450
MTKKPRIVVTMPEGPYGRFRREAVRRSVRNSRLGLACIAAFFGVDEDVREQSLRWAALLDEDRVSWEEFEGACKSTAKRRKAALQRLLDRAIGRRIRSRQEPVEQRTEADNK